MSRSGQWGGFASAIAFCVLSAPAWGITSTGLASPAGSVKPSASTQPSWELNAGVANSCSEIDGSGLLTTVTVNNPSAASEQGVLSVMGVGQVGTTTDNSFSGIGSFGFVITVNTGYSVPAHTPITMQITTFKQPNFLGGVSFVDTHTWDCTTGAFVASAAPAPVPATSPWGLLVLAGLLLAAARLVARRRPS